MYKAKEICPHNKWEAHENPNILQLSEDDAEASLRQLPIRHLRGKLRGN